MVGSITMIELDDINCRICGLCNRKGKPSVMKGSAYCEMMRGTISDRRASILGSIKYRFQMLRAKLGG